MKNAAIMTKLPVATVDKRRALIGLAHKAAALAGLDDETRRAVQVEVTGKESCGEMSERELLALLRHYKAKGVQVYIPNTAPLGRITAAQRATIDRLAAAIGLDAGQLQSFIARTTKVDSVEFLRKSQASAVISGLQRWADQRGADTRSRTRAAIETLLQDAPGADSEGGEL